MQEFHIYGITGLYDEMFSPNLADLSTAPLLIDEPDGLRRLNGLFWATILEEVFIRDAISMLKARHRQLPCASPQYMMILAAPDQFIQRVQLAARELVNQAIDPMTFFSHIETLSILCKLYTDVVLTPYTLMLTDGILLNETDARTLIADCLTNRNPYLPFLRQHVFPVMEGQNPELIWLHGPPHMSSMAIACYARVLFPNAHICIADHSSEYYSLNKITKLLLRNEALFSVIDSIVLDDTLYTKHALHRVIEQGESIASVPNLMYVDRSSGEIYQTDYAPHAPTRFVDTLTMRPRSLVPADGVIDPSEVIDARLFPDAVCSWRKCAFCGINHKYKAERPAPEPLEDKIQAIKELADQGKKYFWFIDEAITPEQLRAFAEGLLSVGAQIIWQARARFDEHFDERLCTLLARAGLREIRFGLESGSERVLTRMHKFDEILDYTLVKRIASHFHRVGVSTHFPIIIGFPGEMPADRAHTYQLLAQIKAESPSITFNVNLLGLDIASELYRRSEDFDIRMISFPCAPRHFVGNIIGHWEDEHGPFQNQALGEEQTRVMRELLYPSMPASSLVPPHILYRLSETIRNTLIWKANGMSFPPYPTELPENTRLVLSPDVVVYRAKGVATSLGLWYNIKRHCFVMGDYTVQTVCEAFSSPTFPTEVTACLRKVNNVPIRELDELILRLFRVGVLTSEVIVRG